MLTLSSERTIFIIRHIPSDTRHMSYIAEIVVQRPTKLLTDMRSDGIKWREDVTERHLKDDEFLLLDPTITSSGLHGDIRNDRIVYTTNLKELKVLIDQINREKLLLEETNLNLKQLKEKMAHIVEYKT